MFGNKTATQNQNAPGGTAKPSGMEIMMQSLIRSLGVPPDALASYIEQGKHLAVNFVQAMQSTANRLTALEARQTAEEIAARERHEDLIRRFEEWKTLKQ